MENEYQRVPQIAEAVKEKCDDLSSRTINEAQFTKYVKELVSSRDNRALIFNGNTLRPGFDKILQKKRAEAFIAALIAIDPGLYGDTKRS